MRLDKLGVHLDQFRQGLQGHSAHFLVLFDRLDGDLQEDGEDAGEGLEEVLVADGDQETAERAHAGHLDLNVLRSLLLKVLNFFRKFG